MKRHDNVCCSAWKFWFRFISLWTVNVYRAGGTSANCHAVVQVCLIRDEYLSWPRWQRTTIFGFCDAIARLPCYLSFSFFALNFSLLWVCACVPWVWAWMFEFWNRLFHSAPYLVGVDLEWISWNTFSILPFTLAFVRYLVRQIGENGENSLIWRHRYLFRSRFSPQTNARQLQLTNAIWPKNGGIN